jgi:alcohol dehydrogenase
VSSFAIDARIFFGSDRHEALHAFLSGRSFGDALPVVDAAIAKLPVVARILADYAAHGYKLREPVTVASRAEPTYRQLDDIAAAVRKARPDLIIGFGGGSVLDLAKGSAILATNPGKGIDYRGMHKVKNAAIPVVAYPSTAGTGTEVTWTASFIDEQEDRKLGINGVNVAPLCGVLEPELVASCPRVVAVSAGLDTMVHAIEAVTARTATSITAALGARAFAAMYAALPRCVDDPASLDAWEEAQLAAATAGIAMMNAGGGPASGISYPLGVHWGVPHGFAGGVFLPGVFAYNVEHGYLGYNEVYDLLPDAARGLEPRDKATDFVRKFCTFYRRIGGPASLGPWACAGSDAAARLADLTMTQRKENLDLNPVHFGRVALDLLLEAVCG